MQYLKKLFSIWRDVKAVTVSLFLCILWLWIGDTYFSVYIEEIVVFTLWVSLFWAVYPLTKLLIVTAVWKLSDKWRGWELILFWKLCWVVSGLLYFFAWIFHSWILLLFWIIFSWIAGATIYPSYWMIYKKLWTIDSQGKIFWFHQSSINLGYCFWALICAIAIIFMELPYIFLFMSAFIVLSIVWDFEIKRIRKLEKPFKLFWKNGVIWAIAKEMVSSTPLRTVYGVLKDYEWSMYSALWAQALVNLMEYVWFLFIPIIALENNLTLVQVAIITFIMWLPNILNVYAGALSDQYNKKLLIWWFLLIWGIFYILLWCHDSFIAIMAITFWIAFVIAFIFPMVSALISDWIKKSEEWVIAGVKEYIATCWEIVGSLWFWLFISLLGIQGSFMMFGIILSLLAIYIIVKKLGEKHKINRLKNK